MFLVGWSEWVWDEAVTYLYTVSQNSDRVNAHNSGRKYVGEGCGLEGDQREETC